MTEIILFRMLLKSIGTFKNNLMSDFLRETNL